jgi:hypothetical protein
VRQRLRPGGGGTCSLRNPGVTPDIEARTTSPSSSRIGRARRTPEEDQEPDAAVPTKSSSWQYPTFCEWPLGGTSGSVEGERRRSLRSAVRRGPGVRPRAGSRPRLVRISVRTSSGTVGRPTRRRLFHVQNRRKPWRCHAMTVSGLTMTSAACHPCRTRETQIQSRRSVRVSRGRSGRDRVST